MKRAACFLLSWGMFVFASPARSEVVAPAEDTLTAKARSLVAALEKGDWYDVEDADGPVRINLSQVVYVRTERDEPKIGFGLG